MISSIFLSVSNILLIFAYQKYMKILFLVPYPTGRSPSQRFRFEQYFHVLKAAGHSFRVQSFLSEAGWEVIYAKGNVIAKSFAVVAGFVRRIGAVFVAPGYDIVFIHREATPVGPPVVEWLIGKVVQKKIIYDFDDAIWLTDRHGESGLARIMRWRSKVATICRWSFKVSCGNEFLCNYARKYNAAVVHNPTTIDTSYHLPVPKGQEETLVVGWTGTHSTAGYLEDILPALQHIKNKFPQVAFDVISNRQPALNGLPSVTFLRWTKENEIHDLAQIDIGLMPLKDDDWAKGKCGFKALQYMSMEIPAIVSPVGVNSKIVTHGVDGMICRTNAEWIEALEQLIEDRELRKRIGAAGRKKVEERYSVSSNSSNFLSMFERSAIRTSPIR
jgi:glycosyltransferase involved in cell wall biosynthesis